LKTAAACGPELSGKLAAVLSRKTRSKGKGKLRRIMTDTLPGLLSAPVKTAPLSKKPLFHRSCSKLPKTAAAEIQPWDSVVNSSRFPEEMSTVC
jgi:hypothetical protein